MKTDRDSSFSQRNVFIASLIGAAVLTALTWALGGRLEGFNLPEDQGSWWYYWQRSDPSFWSRFSVWLGYGTHQITNWILLGFAIKERHHPDTASKVNIAVLLANALFVLLHLLQTHLWYDGLAQDVPIWTSQYSVIVMLVLLLAMMAPRRGIIFGIPMKVPERGRKLLVNFHGFYIAWALTYTFWFHPMEGNYGLLSGFLYMFLLFIQLSLFNTRAHFYMGWIVLLEAFVAVHGTLISIYKKLDAWPMFLFGFLFLMAFTYIYGLTKKRWIQFVSYAVFFITAAITYWFRGYEHAFEILFIPTALYGGAIALILVLRIFAKDKVKVTS